MDIAFFYRSLFRTFLVLKSLFETVISSTTFVTARIVNASYPRKYIFFNGYTTPYLAHTVKTDGPGVPSVAWVYDLDTNVLTHGADEPLQNVPWLSASIKFNGLNLYPLDDFISTVQFATTGETPPPAILVGAWSLFSGVVLDNTMSFELSVIDENGEEQSFSPWSFTTRREPSLEAPALEAPALEVPGLEVPAHYSNLFIESGTNYRNVTEVPVLEIQMPSSPIADENLDDEMPPLDGAT